MLVGEPGIGKTRMARELAHHAGLRGARVLWGRCAETPGAPPYWPWVQVVQAYVHACDAVSLRTDMGTGAADLATLLPEVCEHLPDVQPASPLENPEQARFRLFASVTAFLRQSAQRQPLLLVLDNLHRADAPSLLLLEFLAQELADSRLLVIGTYRDMELSRQHPLTETLAELARERPPQRLALRGFTRAEVEYFVAVTTGTPPPQMLVEVLHAQTEGNPLFLTEVVRLLMQEGALTPERWQQPHSLHLRVPEGIQEVIGKRLNRLSPQCNQALTIAAVAGREFGLNEVGAVLDEPSVERVLDRLEEAMTARVVEEVPQALGRYQFTHVLIQETLYDELTAARRVYLHRRLGEALERLYAAHLEPHLAQLAHHFFAAATADSAAKALLYAERAGAHAAATLAYEEAAHHYDVALQVLALQESSDETHRCRLLLALGESYRKAGVFDRALATFQQAADLAGRLGAVEDLARAALGFEETNWRPGLPGEAAVQLLTTALSALGEGDSPLKARVLGGLARALVFAGSFERSSPIDQQAIAMARRVGDMATLAATLRARYFTRWRPEDAGERLATANEVLSIAEAIGDKDMAVEAYAWRLVGLMEHGDIEAVDAQLATHRHLAEELRQPFYIYVGVCLQAMRAICAGHFAEGERLAQEAFAIGQRLRGQDASGSFGLQMFTLRREQGRLQELAPAVRYFVQTSPAHAAWRPGLAVIYSELGLEQEARTEFERLAAQDFADLPRDAMWLACLVYLTEVCTFLGDAQRAATLYTLLAPCAGRPIVVGFTGVFYGAASRYLGMLATTMARWEEAQQHFEDALAMNAGMGARPWLAHTQHQYAVMLLARRQPGDCERATVLLDAALALSRALGMRALEARIVALQACTRAQPGRGRTYPNGLTSREVEVLRLMAMGKSNRDIAEGLYVSPNTVANHVRNILTKTNTANRTEAAAYARRHGLLEDPAL
jgi:DNA-binding CsgD family transcriptional regulator